MTAAFSHTPRPAIKPLADQYLAQHRFGGDRDAAYRGIADAVGATRLLVYRHCPGQTAELRLYIGEGPNSCGVVSPTLTAPALRELARCLIDAAHDIDAGD